MTSNLFIELYK